MSEFIKMKLSEARAKFENLDELKRETVRTYYNKAIAQGKPIADKMKIGGGDWSKDGQDTKTLKKRAAGVKMALKRRSGEVKMSEESEQIDELSKETLGSYAHKAKDQLGKAEYRAGVKMGERTMGAKPSAMERAYNVRANKRHAGLTTAIDKLAKEEVEGLDEISKATALGVIKSSLNTNSPRSVSNLASKGGYELGKAPDDDYTAGEKEDAKAVKRSKSAVLAAKKLAGTAKVNATEETEGCMLDTSMGGADQIAQSKTGEIYKKSSKPTTGPSPATGTSTHIVAGKTGEAMNTTAITRRVPAVESAVLDVMAKTFEKRKMFEDASNIAIISPEQRQDWLEVSKGSMGVVDYFNKYKV